MANESRSLTEMYEEMRAADRAREMLRLRVVASGDDNVQREVVVALPSSADYAAVRKLFALDGMALRSWRIPASKLGSYWEVQEREDTKHGGTYLHCPCPAWKYNGLSCKHTMSVQW